MHHPSLEECSFTNIISLAFMLLGCFSLSAATGFWSQSSICILMPCLPPAAPIALLPRSREEGWGGHWAPPGRGSRSAVTQTGHRAEVGKQPEVSAPVIPTPRCPENTQRPLESSCCTDEEAKVRAGTRLHHRRGCWGREPGSRHRSRCDLGEQGPLASRRRQQLPLSRSRGQQVLCPECCPSACLASCSPPSHQPVKRPVRSEGRSASQDVRAGSVASALWSSSCGFCSWVNLNDRCISEVQVTSAS